MIRKTRRFVVLLCTLTALSIVTLSSSIHTSSAFEVPATNTKRPSQVLPPATNTPRKTAIPAVTDTPLVPPTKQAPTKVPTKTLPPTRTKVPTKTQVPTATPRPSRTPTLTPSITPTTIGPINYPENINPLTGLPYPDEDSKSRRNVIVKVSNYTWVVRPQSGLSEADVVWEYEVEGGVTRFAAIFRSHGSDHVGSVRSGRLPDLELVPMYQALLAYSGANDNITKMIFSGNCINPDTGSRVLCDASNPNLIETSKISFYAMTPQRGVNCPPFCRFPRAGLALEHTLFVNTFQLWDLATKWTVNTGVSARGFAFDSTPGNGGKSAKDIFIKWFGDQDARWVYSPTDGKYYRWNTGMPHIDANTGQQLTADNIVVIEAYHKERPDIYESESGSPAIEVQLWGQEKAWVFRDGLWYEGIWMHRNREHGALMLVMPDGKTPITLKPGNTWVEVVRCCDMNGVDVDKPADIDATATNAVMTATAKGPRLSPDSLTKTAEAIAQTLAVSAETAGVDLAETQAATQAPDSNSNQAATETPTPQTVGMLVR